MTTVRRLESHEEVRTLGIDETACRRGHDYIALVHDLDRFRLHFATEGHDAGAINRAADDLCAPEAIDTVCINMPAAFVSGVGRSMSQAEIAFDRFHVIQMANAALDVVRREEVRTEPVLKRTRWGWMKDWRK